MNHLMIAAVAAVFLLFPGFADAAGGWRYTNPVTSNTSAEEPESVNSATTGTTPDQTGEQMPPKFTGSTPVNNTPDDQCPGAIRTTGNGSPCSGVTADYPLVLCAVHGVL